jgi:glycosyltransferase involved in cell wall biosynthesis
MSSRFPLRRVMFLYWGRRGAMSQLALALGKASLTIPDLEAHLSVSRNNEMFADFQRSTAHLFPIDTFSSGFGSITKLYRVLGLRRSFRTYLREHHIDAVVTLMSHVWTPLVTDVIRNLGVPLSVIIHDAEAHPGDLTSLVNRWFFHEAYRANQIVTLSNYVTETLIKTTSIPRSRIITLFIPDFRHGDRRAIRRRNSTIPLRLLFFGRILPYKGLSLFVSAIEMVRAAGLPVEIGVFGEGRLGQHLARLQALGATIENRWLGDSELGQVFGQYDAVVLSHIEASQSGVAALALGNGLPVVTTPAGGIVEQVAHEVTGLIARSISATSLAEQIARLATEPGLYEKLALTIEQQASARCMRTFLNRLIETCLSPQLNVRVGESDE